MVDHRVTGLSVGIGIIVNRPAVVVGLVIKKERVDDLRRTVVDVGHRPAVSGVVVFKATACNLDRSSVVRHTAAAIGPQGRIAPEVAIPENGRTIAVVDATTVVFGLVGDKAAINDRG